MKKYLRPIILLGMILIIFLADRRFGWSDFLLDGKNLQFLQDTVEENLLLAVMIYTVLTVVGCVVLALPGVTFAVLAGILFGPWLGTAVCLGATTLGAVLAFLVGRYFLQDTVKPWVMKNRWIKQLLFEDTGRRDVIILMITRLVPLFPYNLQNFAYGITDMKLLPYTVYTFLFMLPGVAMFTIGSAGMTADENRWLYFAAAAVLLVVVLVLGALLKKRYLKTD